MLRELGAKGVTLVDITQVPEGQSFTSELKHVGTKEYGRGGGRYSDFKDKDGNTYRIFDNYGKERREPKYNFQNGEDYILEGRKGATSRQYRNTVLNNIKIVDTNAPTPVAEPEAPSELPVEAPVEAPIGREPEETSILGDEETIEKTPEEIKEEIENKTNNAKKMIQTKRTENTVDGNTIIPGRAVSPQEAIDIYIKDINKIMPSFTSEEWKPRLMDYLATQGEPGLLHFLDTLPKLLRHFI